MTRKEILDTTELDITLNRLCCELIENHDGFERTVLIGLQPRGVSLAKRLKEILEKNYGIAEIPLGSLDITFFRDDFRRRNEPLRANQTHIDFLVEDRRVIFVDDVLYTGRSVRAALDAIQSFGRPSTIELLVLIDRRFSRDLPIQPDYKGRQVDSISTEKVLVNWKEEHGQDAVFIVTSDKNE